jgi:hypothetical protein
MLREEDHNHDPEYLGLVCCRVAGFSGLPRLDFVWVSHNKVICHTWATATAMTRAGSGCMGEGAELSTADGLA